MRFQLRLLDNPNCKLPAARASIVWIIGEYRFVPSSCYILCHSAVLLIRLLFFVSLASDQIPRLAADALRKLAQHFHDEADEVKLQILNLSLKLYLWSSTEQTTNADMSRNIQLLFQYVMDLCRYDQNYDIRDRMRAGCFSTDCLALHFFQALLFCCLRCTTYSFRTVSTQHRCYTCGWIACCFTSFVGCCAARYVACQNSAAEVAAATETGTCGG